MKRIRVVHVVNVDVGVRIHLKNQLRFLQEQGYDVSAVCSPGPLVPESGITPEGIPVHTILMSRDISPLQDLKLTWQLFRLFRRERYDIVHTHSVKPGLFGRLAARLARVPIIVHTVHGLLLYEGMPRSTYRLWKISELAGAWFGHYALSQSRQDMEILLEQGIYREGQIGYLGNGIDLGVFDPALITPDATADLRQSLGVEPGQKVIAIVGRLNPDKGYHEFAEMARRVHQTHPETHFWILGREEKDKTFGLTVDDIISEDMHEYVTYLGLRSDMPQIYAAMDIFVFPSHHEGFPRSLMEASAMGVPIVATNIRGCREAIVGDQTGLLVPPRDPVALTEAVEKLLNSRELTEQLSTAARAYALENFDEQMNFERIRATYETLLAQKGVRNL